MTYIHNTKNQISTSDNIINTDSIFQLHVLLMAGSMPNRSKMQLFWAINLNVLIPKLIDCNAYQIT